MEDFDLNLFKHNIKLHLHYGYKIVYKFSANKDFTTKKRPRFNSKTGHAYHTKSYINAQKECINMMISIKPGSGRFKSNKLLVNEPCKIFHYISGKFNRQKDFDNISGFLLDCLVYAKIIEDDNMNYISGYQFYSDYSILNHKTILIIMVK